YAAQLQEVDTSHVPPTATVLPLRSIMREDEVKPSLPVEEGLANAPEREGDYFKVHAVLEESQ
ncbi:MAG: Asp-tRNA(Asn)/Glu-tRNA(Gln) amidotransferase GatCAB subunit C, partial [Chloroflexi bacterium]